MRKLTILMIFIILPFLCKAQNQGQKTVIVKGGNGIINSIEFSEMDKTYEIPKSSEEFLTNYLKITPNDQFKEIPNTYQRNELEHEHFDQYFKGIKIEGGGYNFHYKNGKMYWAHGHYVKIDNLRTTPFFAPEKAKELFSLYKNIPLDSVTSFISELIIKEIINIQLGDTTLTPRLVYRIYLYANHANNNEVGYIDAQTGEVILTEPSFIDYSATGTFDTRYSSSRQGITQYYTGSYHLADSTRGAIIHTWDLNGNTNIANRIELSDNDNSWTSLEHSASENDMGFDVHWGIQQVYDHLNNQYGINSFDDNGFTIDSHIHYGTTDDERDNAGWSPILNLLVFGDGAVKFSPVASLDAVAHEYGHGITDFQIGWGTSGDLRAFNEGMSDIWGAIMEYRINPNVVWKIGEQIDLSYGCLRNLENTNDNNARTQISNTYQSSQYNNSSDAYVRGGVLSHWFYLLVNGGSGTNDIGNAYTVYGMGMDVAEALIMEAVFNNYLDNTTTYPEIRNSIVNAALTICSGQNNLLVNQVENAWYAVGVGTQPTQLSLTGPTLVCSGGSTFTVDNLPSGSSINWSYSANLQLVSNGTNYAVIRATANNGTGWVEATISSNCESFTLPRLNSIYVGTQTPGPITSWMDVPPNRFTAEIDEVPTATSYNWYLSTTLLNTYHGPMAIYNRISPYCGHSYAVKVESVNACGTSAKRSKTVIEPSCGKSLLISPNPASNDIAVTIVTEGENIIDDIYVPSTLSETISPQNYVVSVIDLSGNKVYTSRTTTKVFTIPISGMKDGTYFVIATDNKSIWQGTLIVKH